MIIAIDCRALQDKVGGGVTKYTRHLVEALLKEDQENEYVLFTTGFHPHPKPSPLEGEGRVRGYHIPIPNKLLNFAMRFLHWPKFDVLLQRRIGKKIDLLLVPNINFLCVSAICPYILVVHDLSFERFPEFYSWKRRLWHHFIQPKKLVHGARIVVAVSEYTKRDIVELYGVVENKVRVVYPGMAAAISSNVQIPMSNQVPNPKSKFFELRALNFELPLPYILYLGTLEPRKNIEGLIQAFALLTQCQSSNVKVQIKSQLPNYPITQLHLVIAGRPGWLYNNIYRAVAHSPVRSRIRILGAISEEEKAALYKGANCFVYPSFYEGFGFPPLEAASYGVPVITSASSSLPEVIGDAALLIDPTNVAHIAQGMRRILTDEVLRNSCIQKGRACAARFSWDACARKLLEIISEIVE